MLLSDIHAGDRLRVREWDDMADEFGVSDDGEDIHCQFTFTQQMIFLCGRELTVFGIGADGNIRSKEGFEKEDCNLHRGYWNISADMLEPIEEETGIEDSVLFHRDDLFQFLFDEA